MAKPYGTADKANVMPGRDSCRLIKGNRIVQSLHRSAGDGKPFARGSRDAASLQSHET
jgi:hypothetical protein